ncbi:hypothetical protein [Microbacterium sp. 179-I 3D3 NHS]|uniref:hypothetical protein n=1 Tax=Microbacterium sp. 179-I 3D3 NHS TaxID=3142382 RepID=UPI00399FBDA8
MNTTLHRGISHPPDTEDRQVLSIPRSDELRQLALADRLSLRIGLWLLQRAHRPRRIRPAMHLDPIESLRLRARNSSPAECAALLAFDLQRGIR